MVYTSSRAWMAEMVFARHTHTGGSNDIHDDTPRARLMMYVITMMMVHDE